MLHSVTDLQPQARAWLVEQIAEGKTDSGLVQRFHVWLRQQSGGTMNPTNTNAFFLECCDADHINIQAFDDTGHFVYGIYPDGIAPQPESDYVEPERKEPKI